MSRLLSALAALVLAVTLTACSDDEPALSEACETAMKAAADETDSAKADPLIADTLSACTTADEWLDGVRAYPGVMGLNERAEIGATELQSACFVYEDTPVCKDAVEQGLI